MHLDIYIYIYNGVLFITVIYIVEHINITALQCNANIHYMKSIDEIVNPYIYIYIIMVGGTYALVIFIRVAADSHQVLL